MIQVLQQETKKPKFKKWAQCPACGCKDLFVLRHDYLCTKCPWDNSRMLVYEGEMDNLDLAFKKHFLSKGTVRLQSEKEAESESKLTGMESAS
jgi:hypothetical protein